VTKIFVGGGTPPTYEECGEKRERTTRGSRKRRCLGKIKRGGPGKKLGKTRALMPFSLELAHINTKTQGGKSEALARRPRLGGGGGVLVLRPLKGWDWRC